MNFTSCLAANQTGQSARQEAGRQTVTQQNGKSFSGEVIALFTDCLLISDLRSPRKMINSSCGGRGEVNRMCYLRMSAQGYHYDEALDLEQNCSVLLHCRVQCSSLKMDVSRFAMAHVSSISSSLSRASV